MMQTERWKHAIWSIIAFAPFIVAYSEKIWGLFLEFQVIKGFFSAHPNVEVWIRFGQGVCFLGVSLWQAWRFIGAKNAKEPSTTLPDNYGVKQIPIEIGKSRKVIYIQPNKYAGADTARCRVVGWLSRWEKKSSDVIVLYGSRSCGRRETVCRAIPDKLYPLYHITYENQPSAFDDVVNVIMRFAKGTHCRHHTFLINCVHVLAPDEMKEMHKNGEKLCAALAAEKKTARLVFLCTCNETLFDSSADWAFQFEPLNAVESDRFLQEASAALATGKEDSDAYAILQGCCQ